MKDFGKPIATIGVFVGGAAACAFAPDCAREIMSCCMGSIFIIWLFG